MGVSPVDLLVRHFFVPVVLRFFNLPVANAETDLLNQPHALHKNYTDYGYHCFSRSDRFDGGSYQFQ